MTTFVIYYCFANTTEGLTAEVEADDAPAALAQIYDDLEYRHGPEIVNDFSWIRIVRKEFLESEGSHFGKRPGDRELRKRIRELGSTRPKKRKKKRAKEEPCTWQTLPESIRVAFVTALNERNSK